MSRFNNEGIKRRREERVRLLRKKMEDTYSSYFFDNPETDFSTTEDEYSWYSPPPEKERKMKGNTWFVRTLVSLFLLSGAYFITTSQYPQTRPYKDLLYEVFTRSYNFTALANWYEEKFGALPAILPSIGPLAEQAQPVLQQGKNSLLKGPAIGSVSVMDPPEKGVYIESADSMVKSIDNGKVIFVGEKDGIGKTVVIQHSKGLESWYGGFDTYSVALNDWVEVQQELGKILQPSTNKIYFAIKKDGKFVDPRSVVQFE
jgi:stage IV sporulation protein FA